MSLLAGKKGLVMGIANNRSIAAAISTSCHEQGAKMAFSHLPDERGKMAERLLRVVEGFNPLLVAPCDVNKDEDLDRFFAEVEAKVGKLDFFVHSIAFVSAEEIKKPTLDVTRAGFLTALESSAYSLIATTQRAAKILNPNSSVLTLTYLGGEKVVAGYNLMGVAKAALDASVKYLAFDLGEKGIRVNAISAGPIKTLAASAVGDFRDMLNMNAGIAPLGRNVSVEEVAKSALFLLSDLSSGVTGEIMHVDGGYSIMGSPGRAFEKWGFKPRDAGSDAN